MNLGERAKITAEINHCTNHLKAIFQRDWADCAFISIFRTRSLWKKEERENCSEFFKTISSQVEAKKNCKKFRGDRGKREDAGKRRVCMYV